MENMYHFLPVAVSSNFYDSSSSDEEQSIPKIDNYSELTVPRMADKQFQAHFRMSKSVFEILINMAGGINQRNPVSTSGFPEINLQKEFLITIWYLANLESMRSVSERFGIAKSTCWNVLYRTCNILDIINRNYGIIKWPNEDRQLQIAQGFSRNSFVDVIGCIDGTHIKIKRPKYNSNSYVNRKGYHSLLLQAICDHKMLFIDVYAGEAGSLHDYTLYKRSEIYKQIRNRESNFFRGSYILGDLAYKLSTNLIVGFKDNGHLSNRQKLFNNILSKIRVKIENAFGLLKYLEALDFLEQNEILQLNNELDSDEEEDIDIDERNMAITKRNEIIEGL
ncbi:uncharacterized protein [Prorops nasuta]|uniref:uncharacterized protein n=1 Tax=Prorops nasuta TaxID=863751 RepID=UPI0034D018B3